MIKLMLSSPPTKRGFSLVELAIVLVILGLLVGGVLAGKSLIHAAKLRSAMTQIQEYQVAARTFREKYFFLPGDLPQPTRGQAGFHSGGAGCTNCTNSINGNGVIVGLFGTIGAISGEPMLFWHDLAKAGLIKGSFTIDNDGNANVNVTGSAIANYLPASKLGGDQYIHVWSGGIDHNWQRYGNDGLNYISIVGVTTLLGGSSFLPNRTMAVFDAYSMDKKMDDGLPQLGAITVMYSGNVGGDYISWAGLEADPAPRPGTTAVSGSSTSCMDNGGVIGTMQYSVGQNEGNNKTCALSFRM